MMTMLVTGGAGFIGSNFVRLALAQTDARVVVIDKLTYAGNLLNLSDVAKHPRFAFVKGAIADRRGVRAIFREHRPTWIINLAAESHVDRSIDGPRPFIETNLVGMFELLDASRVYATELGAEGALRFASCRCRPTRSMERWAKLAGSRKPRPTPRILHMPHPRPGPIIWSVPTMRPTGFRH
jgi:dTDP-glucose 4,6-dehydratase